MDRGAWQTTVHGIEKNGTCLKRLSTAHSYFLIHSFILAAPGLRCGTWDLLVVACKLWQMRSGSLTRAPCVESQRDP